MKRLFVLALLAPLLAAPAVRGDDLAPGSWKITTLSANGATELTFWVLKLDSADGKTTATLASANPAFNNAQLRSFTLKGDTVRAVLFNGFNEQVFDGKLAGKDGKKVIGTLGTQDFPNPAWMVPTDVTELDKTNMQKPAGEAGAGLAALFKLRIAKKDAADKDLVAWSETASKDAITYGPAWQLHVHSTMATALVKFPNQTTLAVKYAELAEKALPATATPAKQMNVLETLARAQGAAGKDAAARAVMTRVAKIAEAVEKALPATALPAVRISALETLARAQQGAGNGAAAREVMEQVAKIDHVLDKEYIATGLPFKPEPFAGRKSDSKRAVVLELFTGAQCPPCVAADLAFDGLVQSYQPSDLVLIQYHMHIPGPDPLTNSDTEARWKYYQDAFSVKKFGGVPAAALNGKTPRVGGGPLAFAEKTYTGYRDMIDPLLEMPAGCQLKATAKRLGDKIEIQAEVLGMDKPGPDKKLRLLLLEETVHYGGGNKIRIHHHVVRAMPGGADGKAVTEAGMKTTASVDLPELRKTLTSYLDEFVATRGPFPRYIRPMEMRDLRVVALVQDDETHEILQAIQVGVEP